MTDTATKAGSLPACISVYDLEGAPPTIGEVCAAHIPAAFDAISRFVPPHLRAAIDAADQTTIAWFVTGGAVVRALCGLPLEGADCDMYVPDAAGASMMRARLMALHGAAFDPEDPVALDAGWVVECLGSMGHQPVFDVRLPGSALRIDVIGPDPAGFTGLREFLDRFDLNLCRCAWSPVSGLFVFSDRTVAEDLEARRVTVRDVPWIRPHREAKYRVLLGLGPRADVVLPYLPVGDEPIPEGFRALSEAEYGVVHFRPDDPSASVSRQDGSLPVELGF